MKDARGPFKSHSLWSPVRRFAGEATAAGEAFPDFTGPPAAGLFSAETGFSPKLLWPLLLLVLDGEVPPPVKLGDVRLVLSETAGAEAANRKALHELQKQKTLEEQRCGRSALDEGRDGSKVESAPSPTSEGNV